MTRVTDGDTIVAGDWATRACEPKLRGEKKQKTSCNSTTIHRVAKKTSFIRPPAKTGPDWKTLREIASTYIPLGLSEIGWPFERALPPPPPLYHSGNPPTGRLSAAPVAANNEWPRSLLPPRRRKVNRTSPDFSSLVLHFYEPTRMNYEWVLNLWRASLNLEVAATIPPVTGAPVVLPSNGVLAGDERLGTKCTILFRVCFLSSEERDLMRSDWDHIGQRLEPP